MIRAVDLLIVGAGPTGLVMAYEAMRYRLSCRIIDRAAAPSTHSKALVVQARTMEVFDAMNPEIAAAAIEAGQWMYRVNAYTDGQPVAQLSFDGLDSPFPAPLILAQSETEQILIDSLTAMGLQIEREIELVNFHETGEQIVAQLRDRDGNEELQPARWIVGCDGAHSTVRHLLGLSFEGASYQEEFLLADVRIRWSLPAAAAHGFISDRGLMAFLPMRGAERYRIIANRNSNESKEFADPTMTEIEQMFAERVGIEAELSEPAWLATFRLHRRVVSTMQQSRAFLCGDAAHIHSPAGGQGMNIGIQDAYNLGWKLALVARGLAQASLLESYNSERQPIAREVVRSTDLMFRFGLTTSRMLRRIIKLIAPRLLRQSWFQERARNFISELLINYRHSPIVQDLRAENGKERLSAGDRLPDIRIETDKNAVHMFDLIRGPHFSLLCFSANQEHSLLQTAAIYRLLSEHFAGLINPVLILRAVAPPAELYWPDKIVLDADGSIHNRYQCDPDTLMLVRPDGYLGFIGRTADQPALVSYLNRLLIF